MSLSREAARDAAREELSRREYADARPPAFQRAIGRVTGWIGDRLDQAAGGLGSSVLAQLALVLLLVVIAVVVLVRLGPTASSRRRQSLFDDLAVTSADQHRAQAAELAGQGRWAEAVRERLRAVVRELESHGVLDARPGRTAGEVARDAGTAVPALAGDLSRAAAVFGEVWYGGREAGPDDLALMAGVDDRVRGSRTAPS